MLKTHKIALDPNNVQATQFAQHCGYARVAYNHVLADFKFGLNAGKWHSHIELSKLLIRSNMSNTSGVKHLINVLLIMRFTLISKTQYGDGG